MSHARFLCVWIAVFVLAVNGLLAQDARPFRLQDPLRNAKVFTDTWDADFGFAVTPRGVVQDMATRQFAIPKASPWGQHVTAEAVVTVRRGVGDEWKTAGVTIMHDAGNYWHVALCESPKSGGRQRIVDFQEMRANVWLAQWEDKLPQLNMPAVPDFQWQYDTPYRLRLEMTPDSIIATIEDGSSRMLWQKGFRLREPAVMDGRPGITAGGFAAEFRDFDGTVTQVVPAPKTDRVFPAYQAASQSPVAGRTTGFFHVEQMDGRWWLVDPAGNAMFFIATDHVNFRAHYCEALGYAPYNRNVVRKYSREDAWADATSKRLISWGFNALGAGASASMEHRGLSHTRFLNLGADFAALGPEYQITFPKNGKAVPCSYFPNVFHPRFADFCRAQARKLISGNQSDPWLLGYFIDNELAWWGPSWNDTYGLSDDCMRKPADHSAKRAVVEWLREKYPDVDSLSAVWGMPAATYGEIYAATALTGKNTAAMEKDKRAFVEMIADRYFATTTAAIREADPNHLILGCRFAGLTNPSYPNAWAAAGKYCDVISVNIYEKVDLKTGEVYSNDGGKRVSVQSLLDDMNARIGRKPMMVTEWSYPAYDSGLPCKGGAGQRVNTQTERSFCFETFQKMLLSSSYMVGSSFFMWTDDPAQGVAPWFPEDSNYGLVNEKDEPYALLTQTATKLHPTAAQLHLGRTMDLRVSKGAADGEFVVENAGTLGGECIVSFQTGGPVQEQKLMLAAGASATVKPEIAGSGSTLVVCTVQPAAGIPEIKATDTSAYQIVGRPSASFPDRVAMVTVANPTAVAIPAGPYVITDDKLPRGVDWKDAVRQLVVTDTTARPPQDLPAQLDLLGDRTEVAVSLPPLPAFACRTLALRIVKDAAPTAVAIVKFTRSASGLELSTDRLKLSRKEPSADIFTSVAVDGREVGRFASVVHMLRPSAAWPHAGVLVETAVREGLVRTVLDVSVVSSEEPKYRAQWRFSVYPGQPWFAAELLWIENAASSPWVLAAYSPYATSHLGASLLDDEPQGSTWHNDKAQLTYGVFDPSGLFGGMYWSNTADGQHADLFRNVNVTLEPGKRWAERQPVVYVGAANGPYPKAWLDLCSTIDAGRGVVCQVTPMR